MQNLARCAVLFLAAPLLGQRTWVVDVNNGPGTDFLDLPPAIAAASDGDTLLVRTGSYYSYTDVNKALTILGDPGVFVVGMGIRGLPANKTVVVKGIRAVDWALSSNAGRVHLEDVSGGWSPARQGNRIRGCALVTIQGSSWRGVFLEITDSTVVLTDSVVQDHGLYVTGSRVVIHGGSYTRSCLILDRGPAIDATNSDLQITGDLTRIEGQCGQPSIRRSGGSILIDRNVTVLPPIGGSSVVVADVPGIRAFGAAPGGTLTTDLYAPAGALTATWLGIPTVPRPSVFGPLWIDFGMAFVVDSAVMGPSGHRILTYPVPQSVPTGLAIGFQAAVAIGPGIVVSAPGTAILH